MKGKMKAYFVKCFFFAASSFLVHGVNMLSVGETYVGFLFKYISIVKYNDTSDRGYSLSLSHPLCKQGPRTCSRPHVLRTIGCVAQRCLRDSNACAAVRTMQRLHGRLGGRRRGRHYEGANVSERAGECRWWAEGNENKRTRFQCSVLNTPRDRCRPTTVGKWHKVAQAIVVARVGGLRRLQLNFEVLRSYLLTPPASFILSKHEGTTVPAVFFG